MVSQTQETPPRMKEGESGTRKVNKQTLPQSLGHPGLLQGGGQRSGWLVAEDMHKHVAQLAASEKQAVSEIL